MDLDVSFRDLCKTVIGEAAEQVGKEYRPTSSTGKLSVGSAGEFTSRFGMGQAQTGELYNLLKKSWRIRGVGGEDLGFLWKAFGIR